MTLLRERRFLPLFVTQALGAVNDNLFKNALVVLALYRLAHAGPVLVALAGGVFILPYALFSSIAGQLADKFEKSRLIRLTKLWEFGLMLLAAAGFLTGNITALMLVLFGLGMQAAFFSPLKYGILPDHLREAELVAGNGLIEAGTFLGILTGTVAGGALIVMPGGNAVVAVAALLVAAGGVAAAHFVPPAPAAAPGLRLNWNLWGETRILLRDARGNAPAWLAILAISWFWAIGATVLAELPTIVRDNVQAGGPVVTLLLAAFSVGIGIGALLCARLLRGEVSAKFVPYAALGISFFLADFSFMALHIAALPSVAAFLGGWSGRRMLADLLLLAACGGIYSVPLYAILQEKSASSHRARMIAANNVLNAAAMVLSAGINAGLYVLWHSAPLILLVSVAVNLFVAAWIFGILKRL